MINVNNGLVSFAIEGKFEKELASYLLIRDKFSDRAGYFSVKDAFDLLSHLSRATIYRRLRDLCSLGFITQHNKDTYKFQSMDKISNNLGLQWARNYKVEEKYLRNIKEFKAWLYACHVDHRNRKDFWCKVYGATGNVNIAKANLSMCGVKHSQYGFYAHTLAKKDLGRSMATFSRWRAVSVSIGLIEQKSSGLYNISKVTTDNVIFLPRHVQKQLEDGIEYGKLFRRGKKVILRDTPLLMTNVSSLRIRSKKYYNSTSTVYNNNPHTLNSTHKV